MPVRFKTALMSERLDPFIQAGSSIAMKSLWDMSEVPLMASALLVVGLLSSTLPGAEGRRLFSAA